MANRNFSNGGKIYTMHVMPVMVNAQVLIGAAGAVTSFLGPLVSSVALVSTGIYKVNLANIYNKYISGHGSAQSPVSGLSGVATIEVQNNPSAAVALASGPSITIKCLDAAGAVVAPASGSTIDIMAILNNSSVKS